MSGVTIFLGKPNQEELDMFIEDIKVIDVPYDSLFKVLRPYSLQCNKHMKLFRCANYENPEEEKEFIEEIKKIRQWANININGIERNEKGYIENTIKNIKKNPIPLTFLEGKINKPCVIVSAGPGLDKNIEVLRRFQDRVLIIATSPVQNKLTEYDIKYDIVTSIDPYVVNKEHFKLVTHYPLLAINSSCWPEIMDNWQGLKMMSIDDKPIRNMIGLEYGKIECGMSVSHYSFNLASYLGCDPIIFIGQDLALDNGQYYASDMPGREEKEFNLMTKGYYGGEMETTQQLKAFITVFEGYFKGTKRKIYNCTEGGAFIKGAEHKPLIQVLNKLEDIKVFIELDKLQQEQDDKKRIEIIKDFKEEKLKNINNFLSELWIIIASHNKMLTFFENDEFASGLKELQRGGNLDLILDKYHYEMEAIKHLAINIYMKKSIDIEQLQKAIQKKDGKALYKFIEDEKNTVMTIVNSLKFLKEQIGRL